MYVKSDVGLYTYPIFDSPWINISMDSVMGLLCTMRGYDAIFVVVN